MNAITGPSLPKSIADLLAKILRRGGPANAPGLTRQVNNRIERNNATWGKAYIAPITASSAPVVSAAGYRESAGASTGQPIAVDHGTAATKVAGMLQVNGAGGGKSSTGGLAQ